MREDGLRIDRLLLTTDTTFIPTGFGPAESNQLTTPSTLSTTITRTIAYTYDHLYRLTHADYSTGESYDYSYDAVGNRIGLNETTLLSGTLMTTYTYDIANRLTDRAVSDGRVYTYTWSDRGELLKEWTQGTPVRTFTYNGAGYLAEATVLTLTTVYTYNGDGVRVAMAVAGQGATTYALDYAGHYRILAETTAAETTHYLYGQDSQACLGEVTADEWDYYLPDGDQQVRQTVNERGELKRVWLYDPDGAVLEGPEGPISHLVCGGVYDWSTGLIYKGGHYFDPGLGIWLMMIPLTVVQLVGIRKRQRGGFSGFWILIAVIWISGLLIGCTDSTSTPVPTATLEKEICIETESLNSVYPQLNDLFVFVSPDKDDPCCDIPIPDFPEAMTWTNSDKDFVRTAIDTAMDPNDKILSPRAFGSANRLATELKISSNNPLWLLREASHPDGTSASANFRRINFYNPFFGNPEAASIVTHELAHVWDNAYGRNLTTRMINETNFGVPPRIGFRDGDQQGEDFAESFRFYIWPRDIYNFSTQELFWTDDVPPGIEVACDPNYGGGGRDTLRVIDRSPVLVESEEYEEAELVFDRFDWFQKELTGNYIDNVPCN